jgi:hypothetical protein
VGIKIKDYIPCLPTNIAGAGFGWIAGIKISIPGYQGA